MQFVNLVKRLVYDLTEILILKCLISIYRFIAKVLNDQNLFTESNMGDWFSGYVQCYSCDHFSERAELQLLSRVEKGITVKATFHSTIFDIPMRPLREDQRHRQRFTH